MGADKKMTANVVVRKRDSSIIREEVNITTCGSVVLLASSYVIRLISRHSLGRSGEDADKAGEKLWPNISS